MTGMPAGMLDEDADAVLFRANSNVWHSVLSGQTLQQTLKGLDRAYSNFFAKRASFHRFKKKASTTAFAIAPFLSFSSGHSWRIFPGPDRFQAYRILQLLIT
jgi:putative transposase